MAPEDESVCYASSTAEQKCFDAKLYNVLVLGLSFMLVFTAFQTGSMVEKSVLDSVKRETNGSFTGDGYISLGIIYGSFSISNWAAPSMVSWVGPKISMMIGGVTYLLFMLSFLRPMNWSLYLGSVLIGFGAAMIWTGQGNFLTINSDAVTMPRNSGIFWALLQCSLLFGNMYTYFTFRGIDLITTDARMHLFIGLSAACFLGLLTMLLMRTKMPAAEEEILAKDGRGSKEASKSSEDTALESFLKSFRLLRTKKMLLLLSSFAYTGLELTFFSGIYGTCISNNMVFGTEAKGLIGISGMLIGAGEIIGGSFFGLFGKCTTRFGKDPAVLFGYVIHMVCFFMIFLNLPADSPVQETYMETYIESSKIIAILCSFLLGLGDSAYNTQILSLLGTVYPKESAPAFALYKFIQSVAAALCFLYSLHIFLHWQLLILVVMGTAATLSFFVLEWELYANPVHQKSAQTQKLLHSDDEEKDEKISGHPGKTYDGFGDIPKPRMHDPFAVHTSHDQDPATGILLRDMN